MAQCWKCKACGTNNKWYRVYCITKMWSFSKGLKRRSILTVIMLKLLPTSTTQKAKQKYKNLSYLFLIT